ncbi:hypothetical protein [Roseomonas chloroacetimidivorans]|uniref:hypothetical protein n=1 Tax=Roseomonas chloroacetimidivorans TaxID=1766656 RepID=UPI003C75D761
MNEISKPKGAAPIGSSQGDRGITIAMRHGRGRVGGSTFLDLLIQMARAEGRPVLVGDGDRRNPTLAGYYPPNGEGGATQPRSDETADVKDWLTNTVAEALSMQSSLVIDLGGGDRVMQEYGYDLALVDFCEASGAHPLGIFISGPEPDDFEHVLAIWRAGYFRPRRSLLVMNEHLIPPGRSPQGAFDPLSETDGFKEMVSQGARPMYLPRLPCMKEMRALGLGFLDAAAGKPGTSGKPLDPVRQFMVKQWIGKVQKEFERLKVTGWMP